MNKNTGVIAIIIGAVMLLFSYVSEFFMNDPLKDRNWYMILSLVVIIGGLICHIMMNKKQEV